MLDAMFRSALFVVVSSVACAQTSILDSGLTFELEDVAVIPDSGSGSAAPPRVSVVTQDPAGRLFVSDQRGRLHHVNEQTGVVTEYLDLNDEPTIPVVSTFEAGFQAFAFHPDFHDAEADGHGLLYTIHSCGNTTPAPDFDTPGSAGFHTVVLEWETDDPSATTFLPADGSAPFRELLRLDQPFGNHNAGLIAFNPTAPPGDPDRGMLYIAIGDGGSGNDPQNNGQTASNPFGAVLRIDPLGTTSSNGKYGIPADNVFFLDAAPGTLAENYCIGLRNPQRFGWDLVTGEAYLSDIGQDLFEEINRMANGANFGWDLHEGAGGAPTYVDPVAGYFHNTDFPDMFSEIGNRAVTCSDVFRGTCISGFDGVLLAADFPNGRVFRLNVDTDPLDGGVDGLGEVRFRQAGGSRKIFLELVNAARAARGLGSVTRTDIRFSVNTPGRVFVSNKQDGVLRRIVPDLDPAIALGDDLTVTHTGIVQVSEDLRTWRDLVPQPTQGAAVEVTAPRRFFRSIRR